MLMQGADTLDAGIEGVKIQELDPNDDSVGYGGLPTESSFGSSSWIFTPSITASRVSAPWSSRSNAFCTARNPLALATATGFAAQRLCGGSGCGGRIGNGMS